MKLADIDRAAILTVLNELRGEFRTKDVSEPAAILDPHEAVADARDYHARVGRYLSKHADTLGIRLRDRRRHPRGALWEKVLAASPALSILAVRQASVAPRPVRPGHCASLEYMASPEFAEIKQLFEAEPEIGGVYFRPLDKGVRVVDLDPESPRPLIEVGRNLLIKPGTTAAQVQPTMAARVACLKAVRARQVAPSREKQLEARLIRAALADGLRLPGEFPQSLRFIHGQWREDAPGGEARAGVTDLLAVDLTTRRLVLIELKVGHDPRAIEQVRGYATYFATHAKQLMPFFTRLARVMGTLYGCPELTHLDRLESTVDAMTAWPAPSGAPDLVVTVVELEAGVEEEPAPGGERRK